MNYQKYIKYIKKNLGGNMPSKDENIFIEPIERDIMCKDIKIFNIEQIEDVRPFGYNYIINKKLFKYKKEIARGSYGRVCEYVNDNNECIAIKLSLSNNISDLKQDIEILNYMKMHNICTNIYVKSYIISNYAIIMDYMHDNLKKCLTLSTSRKILIFGEIVKHIYCLEKANLYYTDIKLQNFLYRCNNDETINILLGDIGSIVNGNTPDLKNFGSATYPPPEFNDGFIKIDDEIHDEKQLKTIYNRCIVWSIGITFLTLFGISDTKYMFDDENTTLKNRILNIDDDINIVHNILNSTINEDEDDEQIKKNSNLILCIKNILRVNPEERISLHELYSMVENKYSQEMTLE